MDDVAYSGYTYAEELRNIDFMQIDPDDLIDINNISINRDLPKDERVIDFIRQIGNPYLYKCGKVIVQIGFANTEETLEDRLESYLLTLQ